MNQENKQPDIPHDKSEVNDNRKILIDIMENIIRPASKVLAKYIAVSPNNTALIPGWYKDAEGSNFQLIQYNVAASQAGEQETNATQLKEENERLRKLLIGQSYSIWKGCGTDLNFKEWQEQFIDGNSLNQIKE